MIFTKHNKERSYEKALIRRARMMSRLNSRGGRDQARRGAWRGGFSRLPFWLEMAVTVVSKKAVEAP
jgi:hypothetical protein